MAAAAVVPRLDSLTNHSLPDGLFRLEVWLNCGGLDHEVMADVVEAQVRVLVRNFQDRFVMPGFRNGFRSHHPVADAGGGDDLARVIVDDVHSHGTTSSNGGYTAGARIALTLKIPPTVRSDLKRTV